MNDLTHTPQTGEGSAQNIRSNLSSSSGQSLWVFSVRVTDYDMGMLDILILDFLGQKTVDKNRIMGVIIRMLDVFRPIRRFSACAPHITE